MSEIVIRELKPEEYADFLNRVPHSTFHRLAWLNVVAKVHAVQLRFLGYVRHGELCAVTPLMGRHMGPFKLWGSPLRKCSTPPAIPFCSPATDAEIFLPALRQWTREHGMGYVQITAPGDTLITPDIVDRIEPLDNLELNLDRPLAEIWKSLPDSQRSCVRKAVRANVTVHWRTGTDLLDVEHALLHDTYAKQKVRPNHPHAMYSMLLSKREVTGLRVLCACHSGQIVSAVWILNDYQTCYYWDAASLTSARSLNANHLLVWCLIRWAHKRGFSKLDFVGTSVGGRGGSRPGIGHFKQSMGARPIAYQIAYWYSPLMKAMFAGYRRGNRFVLHLRNIRSSKHVRHS